MAHRVLVVIGTRPEAIKMAPVIAALGAQNESRGRPSNPYGDGRAGERTADILVSELSGSSRRTVDWAP